MARDHAADICSAGVSRGVSTSARTRRPTSHEGAALHEAPNGCDDHWPRRGAVEIAPERSGASLQWRELAQLTPEGQRVGLIELVDLAPYSRSTPMRRSKAIAQRTLEGLDAHGGDRLQRSREAWIPEPRGKRHAWRWTAPDTSKGVPSAAQSASIAEVSSRPSKTSVPVRSGRQRGARYRARRRKPRAYPAPAHGATRSRTRDVLHDAPTAMTCPAPVIASIPSR